MLAGQGWESIFEVPQIIFIMSALIPIAAIVGGHWASAQKTRSEHDLKKSLVERGLSADEIERIMAAGHKDHD